MIDLSRATVLPGLIDAHTHIFLQGEDPEDGYDAQLLKQGIAFRAARATALAGALLEQGFTTIRDVETEGAGYGDVGIKQAIERGYIPGPRMFVVTRAISTTGGYPLEGYAPELDVPKGAQLIDGPVEARKAAREQLSNGADWIKVYMTHRSWVDSAGQPRLAADADASRSSRRSSTRPTAGAGRSPAMPTAASACTARSTAAATRSSTASISTTRRSPRWCGRGRGSCPTMSPYYKDWAPEGTPEGAARPQARRGPRAVAAEGHEGRASRSPSAPTSAGFPWSEPIAQEFARMVEFGMTPMAAIQSATSKAAEMLGMAGQLGVVAPGAYADIVAVDGRSARGRPGARARRLRDEGREGLPERRAARRAQGPRRFSRSRNSSRTDCVLKMPRIAEVTVSAPGFLMPRISTQRCRASTTTITPWGSSFSAM